MDGLRSNHTIERVFVLGRKTAGPECVLETDGQWQITCRLNGKNEIVNKSLRLSSLPNRNFVAISQAEAAETKTSFLCG